MLSEEELKQSEMIKQLPVDSAHMSYFVFPKETKTYEQSNNGFMADISRGTYNCYLVKNNSGRIVRSGLKKTKLIHDEELIGQIKVHTDNTHKLQIIDPGYTYRNLIVADAPVETYMKFWGADENLLAIYLKKRNYTIYKLTHSYGIDVDDKEKLEKEIKNFNRENPNNYACTTFLEKNMFYDNLLELGHKIIRFEDVDENMYRGFVTMTGWGDGFYDLIETKDGYEVFFIDEYSEEEFSE